MEETYPHRNETDYHDRTQDRTVTLVYISINQPTPS